MKEYRLAKVAYSLNRSISVLTEYLNKNGYQIEAIPTAKVSEQMYRALLSEFSVDKEHSDEVNNDKSEISRQLKNESIVNFREPPKEIPNKAQTAHSMTNNENILTEIQKAIRYEFTKQNRSKSKTDVLSESNMIYRSICNDAHMLFSNYSDILNEKDIIYLSLYFREYLIAFTTGKPGQMAFYTVQIIEYLLQMWYSDFGGYEKIKAEALNSSEQAETSKYQNPYTALLQKIQNKPNDEKLSHFNSSNSIIQALGTPFYNFVVRNVNENRNSTKYLDYNLLAVLRFIRNKHSHAANGKFEFKLNKKTNEEEEEYRKRTKKYYAWIELENEESTTNVSFIQFHQASIELILTYRFYLMEFILLNKK